MSEQTAKTNHLKWLLPLLILIGAVLIALTLVKLRKPPEKLERPESGLLVEILPIRLTEEKALISATGTVEARRQIALVAEVTGKLTWVSSRFVAGGFFHKGDKLLEIDRRDYELALRKAEADLAQAETALRTEQEQAAIARREWERVDLPDKGEAGPLVLHLPQLEGARANLAAARAGLELAQLNLDRTRIYAPFNGRLRDKKVDLGEYVRSGAQLGAFAGTDHAEIVVPLPPDDLRWLDIPRVGSGEKGSPCTVTALFDGDRRQWQGHLSRSLGEIDAASRMARVVVNVADPYNLRGKEKEGAAPLATGLFVDVAMDGKKLGAVAVIPRGALREGESVWLADKENRLEIRPVHVLRRQGETLLIDRGLDAGERLILTNLTGAAPGMRLRLKDGGAPQ